MGIGRQELLHTYKKKKNIHTFPDFHVFGQEGPNCRDFMLAC